MKSKILVINAGSSSIKWQIFEKDTLDLLGVGLIERIGLQEAQNQNDIWREKLQLEQRFSNSFWCLGESNSTLKRQ